MTEERKGMLAASVAYSIFGLSYLFSKMAMNVTEPMILLCVRFSVTLIILNLLRVFGVMKCSFKGKNLLTPILLGILNPVLYFVFENYGLKYTTTSFTGVISSMSPIFSTLLGVIFLRERPNGKQWICVILSITGVIMMSIGSNSGENTIAGCLCLLTAYFVGASYTILVRRIAGKYTAFEITYLMFTVGFIFFLIMAFFTHGSATVSMIGTALSSWEFLLACLYLGGASSVGAYMLSNYALLHLPVTRATIFNCFATLVSVLSGVIIMRDPFTWVSALAFALILFGVWGVNRFAKAEA